MEGRCNVSPAELFRGCKVIGEIRSAQGVALAGGIWAAAMNARLWAGCPHPSARLVPTSPAGQVLFAPFHRRNHSARLLDEGFEPGQPTGQHRAPFQRPGAEAQRGQATQQGCSPSPGEVGSPQLGVQPGSP